MPHKRNPIASENLCGLARVVRSNSLAAMENVALWHERDISHSSVERIIIPDSTILLDYMLVRLTKVLSKLVVYPKTMMKTLNQTGGLIYSQRLLLALIHKGAIRKDAYEQVQKHAMTAWKNQGSFQTLIERKIPLSPNIYRLKKFQLVLIPKLMCAINNKSLNGYLEISEKLQRQGRASRKTHSRKTLK